MTNQPLRELPVKPDLNQLKNQAKDLLKALIQGDSSATEEYLRVHPRPSLAVKPRLADAQLALARSYGIPSWTRLVKACQMTDAIWKDDRAAVKELVLADPKLLVEDARGVKGNWGPPMSYAATVGRREIVEMLKNLGSEDLEYALDRACLKGNVEVARVSARSLKRISPSAQPKL
jgi:hypothetical protein